jgi:Rne/Rng family ribonuclease
VDHEAGDLRDVEPFEVRVAVREDGELVNLFIERDEPVVGNIYKGRVANVLRGMDAAFVDIGLARNAFLHVSDVRAQRIGGRSWRTPSAEAPSSNGCGRDRRSSSRSPRNPRVRRAPG